ncbi:MAG: DUF4340 domain-containing protein [Planctomycetota bacterium]|nr:MAG: DUF4340 domain-containing protein [Planctomycetota bacterium]
MSRRNRILLALLLLLGGLALALEQPWRGDAFARTRARVQRLFPGLEDQRQDIARVEIESAGQRTTLVRGAGGWVVAEKLQYPADVGRLASLVDTLAGLDDRDTVSVNPDKQETYSVDPAAGTRVRLLDARGLALADLVGGALRGAAEQAGTEALLEFYVRRADRDEVVLAPEFRPPPADPADWIEPRLLPGLQAQRLRWLQRASPDEHGAWKLAVEAPEGAAGAAERRWRMVAPDSRAAVAHVAEGFAFALANLRAQDVAARLGPAAEPGPEFGFPTDVLKAGVDEGTIEVRLGKPAGEGRRYAWVPGSAYVVIIGEFAAERLRVPADQL